MLENAHEMFDISMTKFNKARKKTYEERMNGFRADNQKYLTEMLDTVAQSDDKEAKAQEISKEFCEDVFNAFAKRGKIRGSRSQDLSMFMIYYVFPALQLTQDENAVMLCDKLLETWRVQFDNPNMGYGKYEDLLSGFKEKIFGMF